jgi:TRAP-type C4-dicarboxylate transport system permease small subunit
MGVARLRGLVERLGRVMGDLAGAAYLFCALFITSDVITRRFFGFSSQGTTEISGYLMAFGIAWGLTHAMTEKRHIRIEALLERFPLRVRVYLHLFAIAGLELIAVLLAYRAWNVVIESWELGARDSGALSIPLVGPQAAWAVGITVFAIAVTLALLHAVLLLGAGDQHGVDRMLGVRKVSEDVEEALDALGGRK